MGVMPVEYSPEGNVVAVVINPKTKELIEVHRNRQRSVALKYPGDPDSRLGTAYWDSDEIFEVGSDEYKRSHSPGSGVEKGKGYGVALYSGLCLRAYADTSAMGIGSTDGSSGSNHSGRSSDADRFWGRCVEAGLAEEDYTSDVETRTWTEEGDHMNDCDHVPDHECEEVIDVSGSIDIEYMASGGELEFQYMSGDNVAAKGLIFADVSTTTFPEFEPPDADVIASLNLEHCYDVGLAELVIKFAFEEGYDLAYVERLARKLPPQVYRATSVSSQLRLPMVSNSARERDKQRAIEREINQVWKQTYGKLTDIG